METTGLTESATDPRQCRVRWAWPRNQEDPVAQVEALQRTLKVSRLWTGHYPVAPLCRAQWLTAPHTGKRLVWKKKKMRGKREATRESVSFDNIVVWDIGQMVELQWNTTMFFDDISEWHAACVGGVECFEDRGSEYTGSVHAQGHRSP